MKTHSAKTDSKSNVSKMTLAKVHASKTNHTQRSDRLTSDDFMSQESTLSDGYVDPRQLESNQQMHPGLLLDLFAKPIIINPAFATITQSALASLLLSYLAYASEELSEEYEGWIHKTTDEWSEWTGMSRFEQASARKILTSLGITEEIRAGMPAKLYMRVNFEHLYLLLNSHAQEQYAHLDL